MTDISEGALAATAGVAANQPRPVKPHRWHHRLGKLCGRYAKFGIIHMPLFAYFLLLFVLVKAFSADVRTVLFAGRYYSVTWVEILYVIAGALAMIELLRVSKPGINNTPEAIAMAATSVVYIVLFALATNGNASLQLFRNTEFLVVTVFSVVQSVLGFIINSRTLVRTIDNTMGGVMGHN